MLKNIALAQFRNHEMSSFELTKQVVIVGQNATGKTNLLEAIYACINGYGFRGSDDELIQHNKDWSRIELETEPATRTVKLRSDNKPAKILEIDGLKKTPRSFRQDSAAVLFEPSVLRMLSGPPELRRAWVDNLISQIDLVYEDGLKRYKRALLQRNNLLKKSASDDQLFVWELKLGEYGEIIVRARQKFFDELNVSIGSLYGNIAEQSKPTTIIYSPRGETYGGWLINELQSRRERDKILGFTTAGPHRDDFVIQQNKNVFSNTGSRGELRSMVLALKFYELKLIESTLGIRPILLLDDVFSELDFKRREALMNTARQYQSFFTTTDTPKFIESSSAQIIELAA